MSQLIYTVNLIFVVTSFWFADGGDKNIKMFYWKFGQKNDREFFLIFKCVRRTRIPNASLPVAPRNVSVHEVLATARVLPLLTIVFITSIISDSKGVKSHYKVIPSSCVLVLPRLLGTTMFLLPVEVHSYTNFRMRVCT